MRHLRFALFAGLVSVASVAHAEEPMLNLPAGTLGAAVVALGQQARVSVAVPDPKLWKRPVTAVRGRMSAGEALRRLLRGSGAQAVAIGPGGWRVVAVAPRRLPAAVVRAPVTPAAEDVVVTASKRDTRLDGFAGTVTLLDGGRLAVGGESGTEAILARIATVSSTHLGAGRNKLFIRGIADSSFTGPTQATVGQYVGDVRLTYNAPDPDLRLYDVASVEVLEGPQGTLYGAGSLGGIIRVVRNAPRFDVTEGSLSAGVSATWHGAPGADLGGVINLPLAEDRAALRLVGYALTDGGYIDDTLRGKNDINRTDIVGGRAMLRVALGGSWTVDAGLTGQDTHGEDSQYADRGAPRLTRRSRTAQGFSSRYWLGELVVGGDIGSLRFLSSTGVVRQRLTERYDASAGGGPERLFRQHNATDLVSNETRLSRPMADGYGWVVGASFLHNATRLERAIGDPDMPMPTTGVTNRIDEATLYGEGSVALFRGLTATLGGRVSHARLSGAGEAVALRVALAGAAVTASRKETSVLPSVALSAEPIAGLTLFARYQQGFRPGGLAIEGDFVRRFHNDRVATLEAGVRHGVAGRTPFDLSVSLSHTRWSDIQADFVDSSGLPSTANIGDGRIYSLSAAAGWMPAPGLRIELGAAINDSKVTEPSPMFAAVLAAQAAASGPVMGAVGSGQITRVPNIANVVARGSVDYVVPLSGRVGLSLSASARYTGKSRLGVGPLLGEEQGNYLDTRVSARLALGGVGVTLGVTNLTDAVGNRFALGTPFAVGEPGEITPLRPRTVRLGVDTVF